MSRCTGHCCAAFPLTGYGPHDLQRMRDAGDDGEFIADMLVYIGVDAETGNHTWTCRHYVDGDCTVYDQRPRMCYEYPYGHLCSIEGCTRDSAEPDVVPAEHLMTITRRKDEAWRRRYAEKMDEHLRQVWWDKWCFEWGMVGWRVQMDWLMNVRRPEWAVVE